LIIVKENAREETTYLASGGGDPVGNTVKKPFPKGLTATMFKTTPF
jgi:hypothetical protein